MISLKPEIKLLGCIIVLSIMIIAFLTLLDLVLLGGKYISVIVLGEENLLVLYVEIFLVFFGVVFVIIETYKESVTFWKKYTNHHYKKK